MSMSLRARLNKLEKEIEILEKANPDDPRLQTLDTEANSLAAQLTEAEEIHNKRMKEEDLKRREESLKARIESKFGGGFGEWEEWAKSLYPIVESEGSFTVTSTARQWNEEVSWGPYPDLISAREKVEQLIDYKIHDRNRGRGDIAKDLA